MTLQEAKEQVAQKYFQEPWMKLTTIEQANIYDEVAELYAENKAKANVPVAGLLQPDREKLIKVINDRVEEMDTLGADHIADAIIEKWGEVTKQDTFNKYRTTANKPNR